MRMVLLAVMAAALVLVLWVWVAFYLQPQWLVSVVQRRFSSDDVLFYVEGEERRIALTIDDAPSNSTEAILDELKAAGAKATFFIISSYVEGREAVVRRMVAEGHELANHHTKDEASWRLAPHLFEADLLACERVIEQYQPWSSRPYKWYRPGQGFFTSAMLALLKPHKYRLALGNIYPHDGETQHAWGGRVKGRRLMCGGGGGVLCGGGISQWFLSATERLAGPERALPEETSPGGRRHGRT